MLFPQTAPAFPLAAVALLGGLLAVLLAGFEVNRRRADGERRKAERALAEKQNLLNTMQVPLVVVDPNTDVDRLVESRRRGDRHSRRRSASPISCGPTTRARAHYEQDAGRRRPSRGAPTACRSACATSRARSTSATRSSDRSR